MILADYVIPRKNGEKTSQLTITKFCIQLGFLVVLCKIYPPLTYIRITVEWF